MEDVYRLENMPISELMMRPNIIVNKQGKMNKRENKTARTTVKRNRTTEDNKQTTSDEEKEMRKQTEKTDETHMIENMTINKFMIKPTRDYGRGTQGHDRDKGGRKRKREEEWTCDGQTKRPKTSGKNNE